MSPLVQMFLFGLADSALEPFGYGCAAFVLTYRAARTLPVRLASVAAGIAAFLWMDDIWPRIAFQGGRLGMAAGDPSVSRYLPRGQDLGTAAFHSGGVTDLFGVASLSAWDWGSALIFVPAGFLVGMIVTGQFRKAHGGWTPSTPSSFAAESTPRKEVTLDSARHPEQVQSSGGTMNVHVVTKTGAREKHTLDEVNDLLERGALEGDELAWRAGMDAWMPLSQVGGIRLPTPPPLPAHFDPQPPPLPAPHSALSGAISSGPVAAAPSPATVIAPPATTGPVGIGGWLRFFSVSIGILAPLMTLAQAMRTWEEASPHFSALPGLRDYLIVGYVGSGAIAVAGIVVSILLEKIPPNGRALANAYLAIRFFGFVLVCFAQYAAAQQLPPQALNALSSEIFGVFLRECLFLIVWGLYFSRSRRVRNTFVPRLQAPASSTQAGSLGL